MSKCSVVDCNNTASDSLMVGLDGGAVGSIPLCSRHLADHTEQLGKESSDE